MIAVNKFVRSYRKSIGMSQSEWARKCGILPTSIYVKWERGEVQSDTYAINAMSQIPSEVRDEPTKNAPFDMKAIYVRLVHGNAIFTESVDGIGIGLPHYLRCLAGQCVWNDDVSARIERIFERSCR